MSWNVKTIGTRAAVAAKINADRYIPQGLKDVVSAIAAATNPGEFNGLAVESSGHMDGAGGNVYDFKVQPVALELDKPKDQDAAAGI
jgi:hypothetical protein